MSAQKKAAPKTIAIRPVVLEKKAKKHALALKRLAKAPVGTILEIDEIDKHGFLWIFRYAKMGRRDIVWKAHGFERVR